MMLPLQAILAWKKEDATIAKKNIDEMEGLVNSIEEERGKVCSLNFKYSIFRVSEQLRKLNPEAYIPQLVSIGPLHYNDEHLKHMQTIKLHCLNNLLIRQNLETSYIFVKAMSEWKEEAENCYSEITSFQKDEFVKMMVIDGCFILEILFMWVQDEDKNLFSNALQLSKLLFDLLKLENQLPFFVLERLYGLMRPLELPRTFSHFVYVGFLYGHGTAFHGPLEERLNSLSFREGEAMHILDLFRIVMIDSSTKMRKGNNKKLERTSCASELKSAGVKFQKELSSSDSATTSLFDIDFDMDRGVLTIPSISIYDETEGILRNLIAFEQGQENIGAYFTAYGAFMDGLIDTQRDVELLEREGIIENHIGNPEDVVTLFNNITKHVAVKDFYFSGVIKDVEIFQNKRWNRWKEILRQEYFNTPWALISFLAAVFLLILTVVQTIISILQFV